jgi:hypothetical protein
MLLVCTCCCSNRDAIGFSGACLRLHMLQTYSSMYKPTKACSLPCVAAQMSLLLHLYC